MAAKGTSYPAEQRRLSQKRRASGDIDSDEENATKGRAITFHRTQETVEMPENPLANIADCVIASLSAYSKVIAKEKNAIKAFGDNISDIVDSLCDKCAELQKMHDSFSANESLPSDTLRNFHTIIQNMFSKIDMLETLKFDLDKSASVLKYVVSKSESEEDEAEEDDEAEEEDERSSTLQHQSKYPKLD